MVKKRTIGMIVAIGVVVLLVGTTFMVMNTKISITAATDYSNPDNWMISPQSINKTVDVFYLYPTTHWQTGNATGPEICSIDNSSMRAGAQQVYERTATAFLPVANIFTPYYRQMDLWPGDRDKTIAGIPTLDATAAFDYYIKNLNGGRPFILAGHSQGSTVMTNLLSGYLKDNPSVYDRMIVAYVIGYTVNNTYLANNPHLKFATGPNDTGVIVSYNTESPDVESGTNPVHAADTITINPISWSRSEDLAPASAGLGSYLPNAAGGYSRVPQFADAQINNSKGSLITHANLTNVIQQMGPGILHSYDYMFYYYNLQANAGDRIANYFAAHQK